MLVIASVEPIRSDDVAQAAPQVMPGSSEPPPALSEVASAPGDTSITYTAMTLGGGLQPLTTYKSMQLESERLLSIAKILSLPEGSITSFRWGQSMAPAGHPRAGTRWYRVTAQIQGVSTSVTIWVDAQGSTVERVVK